MMLSMTSGKGKSEFSYGKKRLSIFDYAKIGVALEAVITIAAFLPGVDRKKAFNTLDKVQQKLNIEVLNDYIIRDNELVGYRIERTLDDSIRNYEKNI